MLQNLKTFPSLLGLLVRDPGRLSLKDPFSLNRLIVPMAGARLMRGLAGLCPARLSRSALFGGEVDCGASVVCDTGFTHV